MAESQLLPGLGALRVKVCAAGCPVSAGRYTSVASLPGLIRYARLILPCKGQV